MRIEIKSWYTGAILFEGDFSCLADAVKAAVKGRANLSRADLSGADLSGANLSRAELSGADLSGANLSRANLSRADLSRANLSRADLSGANLSRADLSRADLSRADLSGANLSGANLSRAELSGANLSRAELSGAKNADHAIACTRICPDGDIIGWKKLAGGRIAKLLIPADAKRNNAFGRKCRAEYAKVLEIWEGKKAVKDGVSSHTSDVTYTVGNTVKPLEKFDEDFQNECASGIHFFITRLEAEEY